MHQAIRREPAHRAVGSDGEAPAGQEKMVRFIRRTIMHDKRDA